METEFNNCFIVHLKYFYQTMFVIIIIIIIMIIIIIVIIIIITHPQSSSSSTRFLIELEFGKSLLGDH